MTHPIPPASDGKGTKYSSKSISPADYFAAFVCGSAEGGNRTALGACSSWYWAAIDNYVAVVSGFAKLRSDLVGETKGLLTIDGGGTVDGTIEATELEVAAGNCAKLDGEIRARTLRLKSADGSAISNVSRRRFRVTARFFCGAPVRSPRAP